MKIFFLRELTHLSTSSMCQPPVKLKLDRGNKKSKKGEENDVHCDLSQWEYVEDSHGSQSTKRLFIKLIESQLVSHSSILIYLFQFPIFLTSVH